MASIKVSVERLQPGLHVRLPLKWNEHPFLFNTFKIKSQDQIHVIKHLGLKYVFVAPELSDVAPRSFEEIKPEEQAPQDDAAQKLWAEKQKRIEELSRYRRRVAKCEKEFERSLAQIRSVMAKLRNRPEQAAQEAQFLVENIVDTLLAEEDVALHLVGSKSEFEDVYFHSLNVAVLSMIIAKAKKMNSEQIKQVAMAALFHDIGKIKIPPAILRKVTPLTDPELNYYKMHTKYGVDLANKIEVLSETTIKVIDQHHEKFDGSGYPKGLKKEQIHPVAQIIAVANAFDNLCHHNIPSEKKIPYAALSYLFKQCRHEYNQENLNILIKYMGVYPPGTIVRLTNKMVGLVVSVNSGNLLNPNVLLYDPNVPKMQAPIIALEEKELKVDKVIHPDKLPPEVREYLNPRSRVSYYFESDKG
ncbi:HD-GYP domain-containing protein [Vibrio hippocampi]|uniref:HD-GYP domain-containing protein n=1 Tax=Vibrio hippocampi TaxID=654686 RepID=UPI001F29137E|nr:HD-GYP domain-containing protein [Vibrio hippocampi]